MANVLKTIKSDDPEDFIEKGQAAIGDGSALGKTVFDLKKTDIKLDKRGIVTSVTIKPTITVTRASWGGATGENQTALKAIDTWIDRHEQKHVKIIEAEVAKVQKDFKKDAVGKTEDEVESMLSDLADAIQKLSDGLDAKEGNLDVSKSSSGKWVLKEGPA